VPARRPCWRWRRAGSAWWWSAAAPPASSWRWPCSSAWSGRRSARPRGLVTGGGPPLAGHPPGAAPALKALQAPGHHRARRPMHPHRGRPRACSAAAPAWPATRRCWPSAPRAALARGSGLAAATSAASSPPGRPCRAAATPRCFAAGDVATRVDAPHPRSGVYAVRAGPPLAPTCARWTAGGQLQPYRRSAARSTCSPAAGSADRGLGRWSCRRPLDLALEGPHRPRLHRALPATRRGSLSAAGR
jgi:hypothetical protein